MVAIDYHEFIEQMKSPSYHVYILTGDYFWKREFLDGIQKSLGVTANIAVKDVKTELDRLRFKPLLYPTQIIYFESLNAINKKDSTLLKDYFKKISKNGHLIISLKDFKEKRAFLREFKFIKNSSTIKLFEFEWLNKTFIMNYIRRIGYQIGISFESEECVKQIVNRIGEEYSSIRDHLDLLKSFSDTISLDDVKELIPDTSNYSSSRFYNCLADLSRKKVPYEALYDMLDSDSTPTSIVYRGIEFFRFVYQAKILKVKGILLNNDIIDERKKAFDKSGIKLSKPDLFSLNRYKINEYLAISDTLTLKEIIAVQLILEEGLERTKKGNYANIEKLYLVVLKILGRRAGAVG